MKILFLLSALLSINLPSYSQDKTKEIKQDTTSYKNLNIDEEFMGHKLKPIRKKCFQIDKIKHWTATDKRKIEYNNQSGGATYYYLKQELIKIELWMVKEKRDLIYYFDSGNLVFIRETYPETNPEDSIIETVEQSIYFENHTIIRLLNNMDCGSPFAQDYLKEETERYNKELEFVLNRLK